MIPCPHHHAEPVRKLSAILVALASTLWPNPILLRNHAGQAMAEAGAMAPRSLRRAMR